LNEELCVDDDKICVATKTRNMNMVMKKRKHLNLKEKDMVCYSIWECEELWDEDWRIICWWQ